MTRTGQICAWCEQPLEIFTWIRVDRFNVAIHPDCWSPWRHAGMPARNPAGRRLDGAIEESAERAPSP